MAKSSWLARLVCRIRGHQWVTKSFRGRTKVCTRCRTVLLCDTSLFAGMYGAHPLCPPPAPEVHAVGTFDRRNKRHNSDDSLYDGTLVPTPPNSEFQISSDYSYVACIPSSSYVPQGGEFGGGGASGSWDAPSDTDSSSDSPSSSDS